MDKEKTCTYFDLLTAVNNEYNNLYGELNKIKRYLNLLGKHESINFGFRKTDNLIEILYFFKDRKNLFEEIIIRLKRKGILPKHHSINHTNRILKNDGKIVFKNNNYSNDFEIVNEDVLYKVCEQIFSSPLLNMPEQNIFCNDDMIISLQNNKLSCKSENYNIWGFTWPSDLWLSIISHKNSSVEEMIYETESNKISFNDIPVELHPYISGSKKCINYNSFFSEGDHLKDGKPFFWENVLLYEDRENYILKKK